MYIKLFGAHLLGLESQIVEIEVDISSGLPHFDIVGLPGSALKESKERVRAAIKNSGYQFPMKRITVNLAPADIRKEGSYFDLALGLAILLADEQIQLTKEQFGELEQCLFVGELALDGSTRKGDGIFPLVLSAKEKRYQYIFIPKENYPEIANVEGIESIPISNLKELINFLKESEGLSKSLVHLQSKIQLVSIQNDDMALSKDTVPFEEIRGQENVKRALEVAACGNHHVLMIGPPGSGKTMMASSFGMLLPALTEEQAIEVMKVYSVSGRLHEISNGQIKRPFRSPHHTITTTAMVGGGVPVRPGEISLAHHGVLFLDEFLEFKRPVLEALREPLEDGKITISRNHHPFVFPANFILVVAMNPCPCGFYGYETEVKKCTCSASQIEKYQSKLSGPLYDRLDIHIDVPLISYEELTRSSPENKEFSTNEMRKRIQRALDFKKERMGQATSSKSRSKRIAEECQLTPGAEELMKMAFDQLQFSARGYNKILKLARTIADLNQSIYVDEKAIAEAISYRSLDRNR